MPQAEWSLADWLAFQQTQHPKIIELGLDRVREVARRLALLPWAIPSIIVGGTNGKGSTVAFLTAIARACGLCTGTYTSPHLQRYNERVSLDGVAVDDATLTAAFERIERARDGVALTFFEYGTLAALEIFRAQEVRLALIEVGLGGRLDATNLIDAEVAVLCSVGLDHQQWLGPTLEDIGREKAGIFRKSRPVVLGSAAMPASVHAALAALRCKARWIDTDFKVEAAGEGGHWTWRSATQAFESLPAPALAGPIQPRNAATAIAAFLELQPEQRFPAAAALDASTLARALREVHLRGRLQRHPPLHRDDPEWVLDVAHNEDAARVLAASLRSLPSARRTLAVLGVLDDKDAGGIVAALAGLIDGWVLCGVDDPRGGTPESLRARLPSSLPCVVLAPDVAHGCAAARALAGEGDRIVVLGSFHVVGPALEWLGI